MRFLERFRRPRLVPVAEFTDRARADDAWSRLDGEGIPAAVEHDPGALGGSVITRLLVEEPDAERAQRVIADLMGGG